MRKSERRGATSVEYQFVVILILIAVLFAVAFFGLATSDVMTQNANQLDLFVN